MAMQNKKLIHSFVVLMSFLVILTSGCKKSEDPPPSGGQTVNFGALLDLTVYNPQNGLATQAAIGFALEDLNRYAATAGRDIKFTCSFADTRLDTTEAKNQLKNMIDKGITMFVASPYTSGELKAITPFVNQNPVVVINSTSTAIGLNHTGSHIFRIITDDSFQAKAIIRAAITEGIKAIIPIVRNDVWGNSLAQSFKSGFTAEGGFVYEGAAYSPSETVFTDLANTVKLQVNEAIANYGASKVAVLALTYSEIAGIFTAAGQYESLGSVKWYGCDGNAQLDELIKDNAHAAFAVKTGFMAPMIGIGSAWVTPAFTEQLSLKIALQTGVIPSVFALSAYDAAYIMGLAFLEVGSNDMSKITSMIPLICNNYAQMGIFRRLNADNDLEKADYVFWKVLHNQNGYYWDKFATYWCDSNNFDYRWPQ